MPAWRFSGERFPALTGVRAAAAYLVFFHHYTPPAAVVSQPVAGLLSEGHVGVTLFYVLSGFLITYNYAEKANTRSAAFWLPYLGRRLARIYPLYLFLLALTFVIPVFTKNQPLPDLLTTLMNVTLFKGFFGDYYFSGIPQAWSLTVEECFYFLAPFLFALTLRYGAAAIQALLYATAATLLFIGGKIAFYGFFIDYQFVLLYTFFGRSFEFLAGMTLARLALRHPARFEGRRTALLVYPGIAGCLLTVAGMSALRSPAYKFGLFHPLGIALNNLVLPLCVCVLFAGLLAGRTLVSRVLSSSPALFLGRASYAFYLVHFGILAELTANHVTNDVWRSFRMFFWMNLIAAVLFLLVEHPCNLWMRAWLNRWAGRRPTAVEPLPPAQGKRRPARA